LPKGESRKPADGMPCTAFEVALAVFADTCGNRIQICAR
jgi:hypothetical protein